MPNNDRIYTVFNADEDNVIRWSNMGATGWRTSDLISPQYGTDFRFVGSNIEARTPQPPVQQTISENEWPPEKEGEFKEEEIELVEKRLELKAKILRHQLRCKNKKKRKS